MARPKIDLRERTKSFALDVARMFSAWSATAKGNSFSIASGRMPEGRVSLEG
jgi:hypothetical protein